MSGVVILLVHISRGVFCYSNFIYLFIYFCIDDKDEINLITKIFNYS